MKNKKRDYTEIALCILLGVAIGAMIELLASAPGCIP